MQIVCECVATLRGQKDPDWKVVKGIMAETNFLHSLQTLAVDDITMGQVQHCYTSLCVSTLYDLGACSEGQDGQDGRRLLSYERHQ